MGQSQAEIVHPRWPKQGMFHNGCIGGVDKDACDLSILEGLQDANLPQTLLDNGENSREHVSKDYIGKRVARPAADESVNSIRLGHHLEVCVGMQGLQGSAHMPW